MLESRLNGRDAIVILSVLTASNIVSDKIRKEDNLTPHKVRNIMILRIAVKRRHNTPVEKLLTWSSFWPTLYFSIRDAVLNRIKSEKMHDRMIMWMNSSDSCCRIYCTARYRQLINRTLPLP